MSSRKGKGVPAPARVWVSAKNGREVRPPTADEQRRAMLRAHPPNLPSRIKRNI